MLSLKRMRPSDVKWAWKKVKHVRPKHILRAAKQLDDWLVNRHWRASYFSLLVLAVVGFAGISLYQAHVDAARYHLTAAEQKLIGPASSQFAQLTYNAADQQYVFNQAAFSSSKGNTAQVGPGSSPKTALYGAKLSTDNSQTLTVVDKTTQLSMSLTPLFSEMPGQAVTNAGQPQTAPAGSAKGEVDHVVAPVQGKPADRVYTVKGNGVKEDLLLTKQPSGGNVSFSYKLNLPDTLSAKLDANGNLCIYSADPSLFGNITFGDSKTQAEVMKARQDSPKDNLVFVLPAPVIYESGSSAANPAGSQAKFTLKGDTLTITATRLSKLSYPATIDPSVVVTAANDFQLGGNNEGDISYSGNEISTGGLTGGSVGAWQYTSSFTTPRALQSSVAYNGYMYVLGGCSDGSWNCPDGDGLNDVQYAQIKSDGTLGSFSATTSFAGARFSQSAFAYNGYMYVASGFNNDCYNDVQYAPINADGTVGTWQETNPLSVSSGDLMTFNAVAYNGYMYALGAYDCTASSGATNAYYAPINADGTVGTWQQTSGFADISESTGFATYNGYAYAVAGYGGNPLDSVYYAPINADGTLGTWQETTSMAVAEADTGCTIYDGYLYVAGGTDSSYTASTVVQYAPINADGTVGTWQTSNSLLEARRRASIVADNGYLYIGGGDDGGGGLHASFGYTKIAPAGTTGSYTSTGNALAQGISDAASVAYNGYVYEIGGYGTSNYAPQGTVYSAAVSSDSMGAWSANTPLPSGAVRSDETAAVYNGYIYVLGGYNASYAVQQKVYYASIGSGGTIGTWGTTTNLPAALSELTSVAYNGYLYALGGWNGSSKVSTVYYTSIGSNGALGASWSTANALPEGSNGVDLASTVVADGYMYEIGGYNSTQLATVSYAKINSNGSLGTWSPGASLPVALSRLTSVFDNGYIYVLGGYNGTADVSTVYYAPIGANGAITGWATNTALAAGVDSATTVVADGYILEIAGETGSTGSGGGNGTAQSTTYYASINNGGQGTVGSWQTNSSGGIPGAYNYPATAAYNGYIYLLGGTNNNSTQAAYAPISASGGIGSWSYTGSSSIGGGLFAPEAVAYNGYLYFMGGDNGSFSNEVQYAPIHSDGTLGTWQTTDSFTTARSEFGAAAYNGYLYIYGGAISGNTAKDVQYALVCTGSNSGVDGCGSTAGAVGTWQSTTSFTEGRFAFGALAYDGYLYVIGGVDYPTVLQDVQYAPINSDGTIGAWQYTTSLPLPESDFSAVAENGYVYVMGGGSSDTAVYYASINANGTLGAWQATTSLTSTRSDFGSVMYNGYVYIMGGQNSSDTALSDIQYASLQSISRVGQYSRLMDLTGNSGNGTVSSWQVTSALPAATYWGSAVAYNGYVYEIGGQTSSGAVATVDYAPINANGTIGAWNPTTSLPVATYDASAVAYNGYLYEIGGDSSGGSATVDYAPINANGTLGAWTATASLPTGSASASSVVYNGYVYELGGNTAGGSTAAVYYAQIDANGKLDINGPCGSAWCTTASLPTAVNGASSVAYNGYVYEIGGEASGGATATVDYAPINANGTLGAWTATASLPTGTQIASSVVYNGFVYEIGGANSGGVTSAVDYAPINANGTLGAWTATTGLPTALAESAAIVSNGTIYEIGGYAGGSSLVATVNSVGVNANDPLLSTLMLQGSNTGNLRSNGIRVSYKLAGSGCPIFGSSVNLPFSGSTAFNSPIPLPATAATGCGVNSDGRYIWLDVALDDSQTASFPDVNGNHTTITSFTGIYNPSPGSRLRGGATFSGGSLQSLYTPH